MLCRIHSPVSKRFEGTKLFSMDYFEISRMQPHWNFCKHWQCHKCIDVAGTCSLGHEHFRNSMLLFDATQQTALKIHFVSKKHHHPLLLLNFFLYPSPFYIIFLCISECASPLPQCLRQGRATTPYQGGFCGSTTGCPSGEELCEAVSFHHFGFGPDLFLVTEQGYRLFFFFSFFSRFALRSQRNAYPFL